MRKNSSRSLSQDKSGIFAPRTTEYRQVFPLTGGLDLGSGEGAKDLSHVSELVNMYRDHSRPVGEGQEPDEGGGLLETVPGFRLLAKSFSGETEGVIHGLFSMSFFEAGERRPYLVIHRGRHLYVTLESDRDKEETLSPVATLADAPSRAAVFGDSLYLCDGQGLYRLSSPQTCQWLGGEEAGSDMTSADVTVPVAFLDGEPYEDRNLLTDRYDLWYSMKKPLQEAFDNYGLRVRPYSANGETALEVYGFDARRTFLYLPPTLPVAGADLPVRRVAPGVFKGSAITGAVLSQELTEIRGEAGNGAFADCRALTTVILEGALSIGEDAFAGCDHLKQIALPEAVGYVHPSAFSGTSALTEVYLAGSMSWNPSIYAFPEQVKFHTDTLFLTARAGVELRIPIDRRSYTTCRVFLGDDTGAVASVSAYSGSYELNEAAATGYAFKLAAPAALVGIYFLSTNTLVKDKFAFLTVEGDAVGGPCRVSQAESPFTTFSLPLYDYCAKVLSVTLDGAPLSDDTSAAISYSLSSALPIETPSGQASYLPSLLIHAKASDLENKKLIVHCVGTGGAYSPRSMPDFAALASDFNYTGSPAAALGGCRALAVFDGRLFLTGNPALPDMVFYSTDRADGSCGVGYFGACSLFLSGRGRGVCENLLARKDTLAIFKSGANGGVFLHKAASESGRRIYRESGATGPLSALGPAVIFGGQTVFLTSRGVFALENETLAGKQALISLSLAIDRRLFARPLDKASLSVWEDYLVLSLPSELYLADGRLRSSDSARRYPWYRLADIGHYRGQSPIFRHSSAFPSPALKDAWFAGQSVQIKGDSSPVSGEVARLSLSTKSGVSLGEGAVIVEGGIPYLVEATGEETGGIFYPASAVLAVGSRLYFGTEDGCFFCFNNDRRGIVPPGAAAGSVRPNEIHPSFYTFNHRSYPAGLITAYDDCDLPQLTKQTVRRSLLIKSLCPSGSSFSVAVQCDHEPWTVVGAVGSDTASSAGLAALSAASFSLTSAPWRLVSLNDTSRHFVEKRFAVWSEVFAGPFAIAFIAHRARPKGRVRGRGAS